MCWFSSCPFVMYLAHDLLGVQLLQVSNLNFMQLDTYTISMSITQALMASISFFSTVFETYGKRFRHFGSRISQKTFLLVIDMGN